MKLYKIKHKPTGGYYVKDRFSYGLSTKGKVYKVKQKIGSITITVSTSSPYYIDNPNLNWYPTTSKNQMKLDTHYSDWEAELLADTSSVTSVDNEILMSIAERATMADMYEHFANIDDEGALFFNESFYTEDDVFKEEYQEFFNSRYDVYKNILGFKD